MNILHKNWFCHQCSLQFDSKYIYSLHLKLLHKHKNAKRSNKNELKLDESISSDEKSDSNNQIASDQKKKKTFKCEICQYYSSRKSNLNVHITSVHKEKKSFKCKFCKYASSVKGNLKCHISSVHEGKKPFKCEFCKYTCYQKVHLETHIATIHEGKKAIQM